MRFALPLHPEGGFPGGSESKESACYAGDWVQSPGQEDPLEKGMATHPSILAWRIQWTEEPGDPQSMKLHTTETLTLSHFSSRGDAQKILERGRGTGGPACGRGVFTPLAGLWEYKG